MNKITFGIVVCSICGVTLVSCKKKQAPMSPEIPVNLMKVQARPVVYYDRFPATTVALSQVNILAQVQGAVTGIFFKEGSHVTKGQKLYEIDRRIYEANYQSAVANLKVAEGNLKQAQQDADRYEYLNKYNAVAKQLYDHAIITLQNAKNSQRAAADAVKSSQTSLTYAIITAPFSGTIGFSQVKLGNVVTVGSTILNTISTDDPMAVDFLVNEKQLAKFENVSRDQSKVDSLFTIQLPDNSVYQHVGKVYAIDRAVDSQTGSIRVRLVFPNPQNTLRAGMSCVLRVHNTEQTPQIVVPAKAVVEQMGEYFVFVARDSIPTAKDGEANNNGKQKRLLVADQRKVQVGQTIGPNQVIKSGIEAGDRVVVDGLQSLHDGSQITTANKVPPSAGGRGGRG